MGPRIEEIQGPGRGDPGRGRGDRPGRGRRPSGRTAGATNSPRSSPPRRAAWPSCGRPRRPSRPRPERRRQPRRQQKAEADGGDEAAIEAAAEAAAAKATPPSRPAQLHRSRGPDDEDHRRLPLRLQRPGGGRRGRPRWSSPPRSPGRRRRRPALPHDRLTEANLDAADIDASPELVLADAGYCSEDNLTRITETEYRRPRRHGQDQDTTSRCRTHRGVGSRRTPPSANAWPGRLRTKPGRADYARRKAIVEPAFGQMKVRQQPDSFDSGGWPGPGASGPCTSSATTSASWPTPPREHPSGPAEADQSLRGAESDHGRLDLAVATRYRSSTRLAHVGPRVRISLGPLANT